MELNTINQSIRQYIPTQETVAEKFSTMIPNATRNLTKIAVPTVIMLGISLVEGAEAGPLAYSACVLGCATAGPAAPFCWTCCLAALFAPGP